MEFVNAIKSRIPDYARDARLNLDGAVARSSLPAREAAGAALAAAYASRSPTIVDAIRASGALEAADVHAALSAAALMGMNNVWYPFVEMTGDAELKSQLESRIVAQFAHTKDTAVAPAIAVLLLRALALATD